MIEKLPIVFTKSISKEPQGEDGKRLSTMSRHTEDDGKTPLEGIHFHEWAKEFAPPEKLVGDYYRGEVSWEEYEKSYLEFLRGDEVKPRVQALAKRCMDETITLMCIEDTCEKCHRRLLAEELQRYEPHLKICHN